MKTIKKVSNNIIFIYTFQSEDDGVVLSAMVWSKEGMENQIGLLILDAITWTELGRTIFTTPSPVPKCLHGWFTKTE